MYAIRSYYVASDFDDEDMEDDFGDEEDDFDDIDEDDDFEDDFEDDFDDDDDDVITSYSIHYTKLYDLVPGFLEIGHIDAGFLLPRGEEGGFVYQICDA